MNKQLIRQHYRTLLGSFGPQGWWPVTPSNKLKPQYHPGRSPGLSTELQRLEICIGAILTQNTSWTNVEMVLELLNKAEALNYKTLLRMPLKRLQYFVRSSGYFRQKAERVKVFLFHVKKKSAGSFLRYFMGSTESLRRQLLSLNGIGPETADSMLLYAAGRAIFVVDAYTRRVASRWGIIKGNEGYQQIQDSFSSALPMSAKIYGEYHALIVLLAKLYCRKDPWCQACPLGSTCAVGRAAEK